MTRLPFIAVLLIPVAACWTSGGSLATSAEAAATFTLTPDANGMVLKTPQGRTVFRYMTKKPEGSKLTANSVCCLYPLTTPAGEDTVEFAPSDHPHHRGVFLAWHAMAGKSPADFWGWGQFAPTENRVIQNRSVKLVQADARRAVIEVRNEWLVKTEVMIDEATTITAGTAKDAYVIDFDFRLTPKTDVTLKQTAFSGFCAKSRKDGQATYYNPQGEVKLPDPHYLKPQTDWPSADWYDYTIKLNSGKTIGLAVLDHPHNPKTAWHNLKPIAMLNPCIVAPGPVTVKAGQTLRLRYRLVTHDGPVPTALLQELTKAWRSQ